MATVARRNTDWFILTKNLTLAQTPVTDDLDSVAVTFTSIHNGSAFTSGTLAYEAYGRQKQWAAKITLPSTPGTLTVVVHVSAVIDDVGVEGDVQASLNVR